MNIWREKKKKKKKKPEKGTLEEKFTPWRCLDPLLLSLLLAHQSFGSPSPTLRSLPHSSVPHLCLISLVDLISPLHLSLSFSLPALLSLSLISPLGGPSRSPAAHHQPEHNLNLVPSYCQAEAGSPIQPGPTAANLAVRGLATVGSLVPRRYLERLKVLVTGPAPLEHPPWPAWPVDTAELPFS